jgi:hypothetical protein
MSTSCGPLEFITDQEREDKWVRVQRGKYYGHAVDFHDPRQCVSQQCVGRNPTRTIQCHIRITPVDATVLRRWLDGVSIYRRVLFGKQLRGNLLPTKYKSINTTYSSIAREIECE